MQAARCPTDELSLTNCAVVSEKDLQSGQWVVIIACSSFAQLLYNHFPIYPNAHPSTHLIAHIICPECHGKKSDMRLVVCDHCEKKMTFKSFSFSLKSLKLFVIASNNHSYEHLLIWSQISEQEGASELKSQTVMHQTKTVRGKTVIPSFDISYMEVDHYARWLMHVDLAAW